MIYTERKIGSEKKIIDALVMLMEKKPIAEISASELISVSGVGKSTFYRYYHDVYEVFEILAKKFAGFCVDIMYDFVFNREKFDNISLPETIPVAFVEAVLNIPKEYSAVVRYLIKENDVRFFLKITEKFSDVVAEKADAYGMDKDIAVFFTKFFMNGFLFSSLGDYYADGVLNSGIIDILLSFDLRYVQGGKAL